MKCTMNLVTISCLMLAGQVLSEETPVVLCGRQLAKARALLCFGAEYMIKRSASNALTNIKSGESWWEVDWPWKSRQEALSGLWSRYKRDGLVDECCFKPCTRSEIINYC